jgi:uncharacterized protein YcbK (DUF882 family)
MNVTQTRFTFASAAEIPAGFWRWSHVSPAEWADKTDGSLIVDVDFMDKLETLRGRYGKPFVFDSCYRSPAHNVEVSATRSSDGAHTLGVAADIQAIGADALELVRLAINLDFTGIGLQQKGPGTRFVHLDCAPARADAPRPWLWTY